MQTRAQTTTGSSLPKHSVNEDAGELLKLIVFEKSNSFLSRTTVVLTLKLMRHKSTRFPKCIINVHDVQYIFVNLNPLKVHFSSSCLMRGPIITPFHRPRPRACLAPCTLQQEKHCWGASRASWFVTVCCNCPSLLVAEASLPFRPDEIE